MRRSSQTSHSLRVDTEALDNEEFVDFEIRESHNLLLFRLNSIGPRHPLSHREEHRHAERSPKRTEPHLVAHRQLLVPSSPDVLFRRFF
jgi:hypothetical protein